MANVATKAVLGQSLIEQGYPTGLAEAPSGVYVKVPVFSFEKLGRVDITLGPEMKSTGEVMGKDTTLEKALYKGLVASDMVIKEYGTVLMTVSDKDKEEIKGIAKRFTEIGYHIMATEGQQMYYRKLAFEWKWSIKSVLKGRRYSMLSKTGKHNL